MLSELIVGPRVSQDGVQLGQRAAKDGTTVVTDAHGRYQEAVYRGNVYFANVNGAAATAFTGGAAGTPLIGLMNPAGSGKNLVLLYASVGNRVAASAAGVATFNLWGGPSVLPTGTVTAPTNMLSLAASGSSAKAFVNTAMTASTAIGQIMPLGTYYWATASAALLSSVNCEIGGLITAIPGNLVALGATAALTSATWDATLVWEEILQ